ncbi:hypothetical protein [Vulcanisaeta thermophila]|uniref:hypothetical protein n=1 Tax=Vulcanisaeta thermophila TaxID=867917 RepID=UPI000852FFBE|nr:hypothetical protein [Vulcanisaeta thermophila]
MPTEKVIMYLLVIAIFTIILLIPITTLANNDNVIYAPVTLPVIYVKYTLSMNLTDSRPTVSFLQSIATSYPLLYREDTLVTNTTTVWVGTANKEFTLYITNATPTSINFPVLINATSTSNSTGGITWTLQVPSILIIPQVPVYANWTVAITEYVGGFRFVVFLFRTGNISFTQLLHDLESGYLIGVDGEPYYLWHHYYGYNPTTGTASIYYAVGLPGISVFYTWVGQGINASSWPEQGFGEVLRAFEFGFAEYVNSTLVGQVELPSNGTIGTLTNYGYEVYGRPRLVPFGPFIYTSPILLLANGTVVNPTCLGGTYFPLTVSEILQSGALFPVYIYNATPTGLYALNESLILGGYALAYDFFNETALPLTEEQYLTPPYESSITPLTWCTAQLYTVNYTSNYVGNSMVGTGSMGTTTVTVVSNNTTSAVSGYDPHHVDHVSTKVVINHYGLLRFLTFIMR